jgi:hypothetical protein
VLCLRLETVEGLLRFQIERVEGVELLTAYGGDLVLHAQEMLSLLLEGF